MGKVEQKVFQKKLDKVGLPNLLDVLSEKISLSELNTILLELFRMITKGTSEKELLKKYRINRFVQPSEINPIKLKQLEIEIMTLSEHLLFKPILLSPVAPLGSCSIMAPVSQNKVISATRGTEVLADATNLLALHICNLVKNGELKEDDIIRFCSSHQHVRAQKFNKRGLVTHFNIFCMVSSGKDKGSYSFEKQALLEHIELYTKFFSTSLETNMSIKLNKRSGYKESFVEEVSSYLDENFPNLNITVDTNNSENLYYQGLQFSIFINRNGEEINIGDGGFVEWSQALLGNKKERMLISGIGLDRLLTLYF